MADRLYPDICVIGAGTGGLSVATAAAALGLPVVLIERGRIGGGRHHGALPSKALLAAARYAHMLDDAERFGGKMQRARIEFLDAHARVENVVRGVAPIVS
jgi:pyruvate/2-oxoglutarate dehydrogenase complex dihydrolipoamide dehydrogenase (E3) component